MTPEEEAIRRKADPIGWATDKINALFDTVRANISLAYKDEFADAMAIMFGVEGEPRDFYRRTVANLKPYIRASDMESLVKKILRETREQERAQAQAAAGGTATPGTTRKSIATALVELATAKSELFHAGDTPYASITIDNHLETHGLNSRNFRRWLSREYMEATGSAASSEAITTAINTLAGTAVFKGPERSVYTRIGGYDAKIYLDLGNATWQVIVIDAAGWRLVEAADCPIRFRRADGELALPLPELGGTIVLLRRFVNVANDDDFNLAVTWLLAALRDRGPYPLLAFHGEHGAAKSTSAEALRKCIDPNKSPLRAPPKEPRDLAITASNSCVVTLDNVSRIFEWLSDCLCRLATGGGFSTRLLYSDDEERIFEAMRAIVLTSIAPVVREGDLLDRGIFLTAPNIEDGERQTEEEFWRDFDLAHPRILGALLDAVSMGLRRIATIQLRNLPRMADFARWGAAVAPALGWDEDQFLAAYALNRRMSSTLALETALAVAIQELSKPWQGTATSLLTALEMQFETQDSDGKTRFRPKPKDWPRSANALSGAVRKLAPNLRQAGINVSITRDPKTRVNIFLLEKIDAVLASDPPPGSSTGNNGVPSSDDRGSSLDRSMIAEEDQKTQGNAGSFQESERSSDPSDLFPNSEELGNGAEAGSDDWVAPEDDDDPQRKF